MIKYIKPVFLVVFTALILAACGEEESSGPAGNQSARDETGRVSKEPDEEKKTIPDTVDAPMESAGGRARAVKNKAEQGPVYIENGVIYQEEIYRNWPYTESAGSADSQMTSAPAITDSPESKPVASGKTHVINAEARIFKPDIIYIEPGDTVSWNNMTSHNTVSVEGMIPEGADAWRGALGENLKITLDIEGIYAYVCEPHIGFGMVGLIIVGHPTTLDEVKKYAQENLQGPYRRLLGKLIKVNL